MGGAFSAPGQKITPEYVKTFLNTILREMFRQANLVDLYSLADPERCKGYVVVAANALEKLFTKIQLYPTKDKQGIFFFQKIQGIQHRNPLGEKQQSYCLELAFFFIRIFQTYAALALSIYDSELPPFDWEETRIKTRPGYVGAIVHTPPAVPGYGAKGATVRTGLLGRLFRGGGSDGAQTGGALYQGAGHRSASYYITNPDYKLLNKFLVAPEEGEVSEEDLKFEGYSMLTISQESMYDLAAPGGGVPRRTLKVGDAFAPRLLYRYKQLGESKSQVAVLVMERDGDTTKITLKGRKMGDPTAPEQRAEGQLTEDSDVKLPELLKRKMNELIVRIYGEPPFSAVEFLAEKKYIRNLDDPKVALEGTRVVIERPKDQINSEEIEIKFYDKMTLRKQPRNIEIVAKLKISRGIKRLPVDPTPYKATLNWADVRTDPRELKGMIPFPTSGLSEREFLGKTATSEPVNKENETIPRWIQKVFDTLLKKSSDYGFVNTGIEVTREGFAKPYDSAEMDPKMRIRAVWEALARKPPIKAHCVARAVQLLNVQSIRDSKGTPLSSICRVKFPYIVDKSLPAPGGQITNEYSVLALSQLFVDKIMGASPMITNRPEFQRFKLRLKDMFERVPTPAGESGPETLSDITEKQMPFCAGHDGDYLQVPSDMEGALRSKAQALLDRQATHVRNVMAILFKLFNRKQIDAGVFELNPEVMRGGIETVNKIAEEARELLINYFGDCEETYKDGLYILQNRAAANPAALSWKAAPRPLTAGADASGAAEPARENENNDPRGP